MVSFLESICWYQFLTNGANNMHCLFLDAVWVQRKISIFVNRGLSMRAGRFPFTVRLLLRVALASAEPTPCKVVSFCMMHYSSFDPPCRPRLQVLGVTAGMLEVMLGGAVGVLGQSEVE